MKVLIVYGTRYGSTAEISDEMAKALGQGGVDVDVVNAKGGKVENPGEYDLVLVGSGIKMGKWTREPLKFLERNEEALSDTPIALFVSCGSAEKPEELDKARTEYLDDVGNKFPGLRIVAKGLFGGKYDPSSGFMMRMVMKGLREDLEKKGLDPDGPYDFRDWDAIKAWAVELVDRASE